MPFYSLSPQTQILLYGLRLLIQELSSVYQEELAEIVSVLAEFSEVFNISQEVYYNIMEWTTPE